MPILFFSLLLSIFLGFDPNFADAYVSGCTSTTTYSATTGKPCNPSTFIDGCTSAKGYSVTTGIKCDVAIYTDLPLGCTSKDGFSSKTGERCSTANLPYGCTSTTGYSRLTGSKCDASKNIYLPGCDSFYGISYITYKSCNISEYKPPVITELNGARLLNLRQKGSWTLSAYDPNGGALQFEVYFGDGGFLGSTTSSDGTFSPQYVTFSHAYENRGTYNLHFIARNSDGYIEEKGYEVEVE